MYKCTNILSLNDYFKEYNNRNPKGVYFYRINNFNQEIYNFITEYFKIAEKNGIIIEQKIQNPTEKNIEYYEEILGKNFNMDINFITNSLKKWIPEINENNIKNLANSMYDIFQTMLKEGKNINIIKNTYIKFMCWIYYKFKMILNNFNENNIPKIIYQGNISIYELKFLYLMNNIGCDIVLLQYEGDNEYLKIDNKSEYSKLYICKNSEQFPKNFSLEEIRNKIKSNYIDKSKTTKIQNTNNIDLKVVTNIWLDLSNNDIFSNILKKHSERGYESNTYYNCFIRIVGTDDKINYQNQLLTFYNNVKTSKRNIIICNSSNLKASFEEISKIKRNSNYKNVEDMILDISKNINYNIDKDLLKIIKLNFKNIIIEEFNNNPNIDILKHKAIPTLTNKAVYILCWLNKYIYEIFKDKKYDNIPIFLLFGTSENENQGTFLKLLSKLPIDVIIISPEIEKECIILEKDKFLFEKKYSYSSNINTFPTNSTVSRVSTVAHQAERELDNIIYNNSGIYRNKQYQKADTISLNTTYEEIAILWNQELKYRPNFQVFDDIVKVPVIYSKVCGVKQKDILNYWKDIKKLINEDTYVITNAPFITNNTQNNIKPYATEFFKNKKLLREKIKNHNLYQYKFIRDETQEHIFDKLEILINNKIIKGTFENGTEYTIISTILNIDKEILRLIQKFDFTKINPKIIFINTGEKTYSIEDAILTAFLNIVGFDIIFFIPTGYKGIELYFNDYKPEEHEIGEYMYDLLVPNFKKIYLHNKSIFDKIFKRGF